MPDPTFVNVLVPNGVTTLIVTGKDSPLTAVTDSVTFLAVHCVLTVVATSSVGAASVTVTVTGVLLLAYPSSTVTYAV
ncbi:hypothetical protein D3C74_393020 [compost metagenome]